MSDFIVTIEQGRLRGKTGNDISGNTFYSFQGIPYAKPPLGELRFKAPQPPEKWEGIRDATKERDECFSRHMIFQHIVGNEDCLFLNIYTPQLPGTKPFVRKPVMVWIHGGAFVKGSSKTELFGPEYLVSNDIVLVTLNYRLGLLGFLRLENEGVGVPGNAAFKDMIMALKWVQENISPFGGDPNNVTIFGESAGGAAVHLLMLSPLAKGLFHKVIAQSGCALNIWPIARPITDELFTLLGLKTDDQFTLLEHLQNLPVEEVLKLQDKLKDVLVVSERRPIGTVVEKGEYEPAFLPDLPVNLVTSGNYNKTPLMLGYTNREGMLFEIYAKRATGKMQQITDFETTVPHVLNLTPKTKISQEVAQKIKQFYYHDEEPSEENVDKFYLVNTDNHFLRGIYSSIRNHLETSSSPIYLYRFSVESSLNFYKIMNHVTKPGVCHADDLGYLFKTSISPELLPGTLEQISVERVTKLWTNFARNGDPNPQQDDPVINVKWKPATRDKFYFLDIGENLTAGMNPEEHRISFWDDIYKLNPAASKL